MTNYPALRFLFVALTLTGLLIPGSTGSSYAQPLPFFDNFDDGTFDDWQIVVDPDPQSGPANWVVENGVLVQKSNVWAYGPVELETKYHLGTHVSTGSKDWADYSFNAIVRSADNDGVGLIFRYDNAQNYYRILLMNDPAWSGLDSAGVAISTPLQRIQKFVEGEPIILAENKVSQAYPAGFFALTADVRGDTIRAFLNGEQIMWAVDDQYPTGKIGLHSYANAGSYYDSISVTSDLLIYDEPEEQEINYAVREFRAPYIQNPTQTTVEIAWRSVDPYAGVVKYDTEKGLLRNEVSEANPQQKHHVRIPGLEPSTRYFYAVYQDGELVQDEENFRTARRFDETAFSFLVLGDSGVDTPTQWQVSEEMRRSMNESEIDFVLHVGDVHQGSGDYYDNIYFKPYREIIKNVNIFTSLGNHDVITDNGGVYLDDFYLPHNNPDSTERYYSFRWANAFFIALDTNGDYSPNSSQYNFLIDALESEERRAATWTFVYAHHPPYTEYWTGYYGDENVQNHLVPVYENYDVDMVLNGHTHSYERGEKEHVHYIVSGGGGGNLDDYFVDYDHVSFSSKSHHFTRIDVNDDELLITAINENGQQIDRFTINKFSQVSVDEEASFPDGFQLYQNYPNPAREQTTIEYDVPAAGRFVLELIDILGHRLATLVDREHVPGRYSVTFNTQEVASGFYLYRLRGKDLELTKEFVVMK